MIDFFVIVAIIFSIYGMRRVGDVYNIFNPAVYFFWVYLIFCYAAILYRDLYDFAVVLSVDLIFGASLSLLLYVLGVIVVRKIFISKSTPCDIGALITRSTQDGCIGLPSVFAISMLPVAFALYFLYSSGDLLWLSGDFDDARIELRKGRGSLAVFGICSSFVAAVAWGIHGFQKCRYFSSSLGIFLMALCGAVYGNRAPAIEILVIGFMFLWVRKFGKVKLVPMTVLALLMLLLVGILGLLRQGDEINWTGVFLKALWRPFVNLYNVQNIMDWVPERIPHFLGESYLIDLYVLLPGYQPNFGTYMKDAMGLVFTGGGVTVTFFGEMYSNFGIYVAVGVFFVLGMFLQLLYELLSPRRELLPVLIIVAVSFKSMASSGVISPIIYLLLPSLLTLSALYMLIIAEKFLSKTAKCRIA